MQILRGKEGKTKLIRLDMAFVLLNIRHGQCVYARGEFTAVTNQVMRGTYITTLN